MKFTIAKVNILCKVLFVTQVGRVRLWFTSTEHNALYIDLRIKRARAEDHVGQLDILLQSKAYKQNVSYFSL